MTASPTRNGQRVVIVGGGVVGAACAYYLNRSGWQVTIAEKGDFGRGCSHGNCGFVSPSHVLPLAVPGAVGAALRSLLRPGSPFRVRPRFDPQLWRWFWHFARCCNHQAMLRSGKARLALLESSFRLYEQLLEEEGLQCEWHHRGLLFVYRDAQAWEEYSATDELLKRHFNMGARRMDGRELVQFEPALREGLAGAWFFEEDAHLRPDKLLASWREVLERRGVEVLEACEVHGWAAEQGRARAVETSRGDLEADMFVLATGALAPQFAKQLGCYLPIQPGKGYSLTMPRPEICPKYPMIFSQHRVAVTPMDSGFRLGSTMEFAGYDTALRPERLKLLTDAASIYLREPYREPFEEKWYGWRPMTYDGVAIIDFSPRFSNVLVAAGHNMLGLSMAPATGRLVSEILGGKPTHIDPSPYRLARFSS